MRLISTRLPRISILVLASILILSLSLIPPPVAALTPSPKWSLEPSTVIVNPCNNFTLTMWIRNIADGWAMTNFEFMITWDPSMMEFVDIPNAFDQSRGWMSGLHVDTGFLTINGGGSQWSTDAAWFVFKFHCLHEGTSKVILSSPPEASITIVDLASGQTFDVDPDPFEVTVIQAEPAPVGGVTMPINTLAILTPYLALAGLIIAVSAVVLIKRRRD